MPDRGRPGSTRPAQTGAEAARRKPGREAAGPGPDAGEPAARFRVAVYPGSFDPITLGHLDVVQRAARLFDRVIVAVARRDEKHPVFSSDERVELARAVLKDLPRVEVKAFSSLLVDFAREQEACAIIRGMRAVMDFDYEFQMALTNRKLAPQVETILFVPSERFFYLSSSLVRELARMNGKLDCFVPGPVEQALRRKLGPAR